MCVRVRVCVRVCVCVWCALKIFIHYCLICIVSDKKCAMFFTFIPQKIKSFFLGFKIFSLSLALKIWLQCTFVFSKFLQKFEAWVSLSFLNLDCGFKVFSNLLGVIIYSNFFLPSPPMEIPFTHILGHLKLSHSSQILCYCWLVFLFPWCFILGSSYCFVFMLTELLLYSIISVLSSLVLILSCVFFLLRHGSFHLWILIYI